MKKSVVAFGLTLIVAVAAPLLLLGQAAKSADADAIAAITKIENDGIKAALANDGTFYEKNYAADFTGGTSRGTWDTRPSLIADLKDVKNNKTTSQDLKELKVRVHGDVAIATYKSTYDALIQGTRYARTIICTDTFQQQGGAWKLMADHCSQTK
jgi:ketosteroid isomerase-like protein